MQMTTSHPERITLIRHGETPYNTAMREGRVFASREEVVRTGCLPDHRIRLTSIGRQQSQNIGPVVQSLGPFDIAFHSPYRRAAETLDLVLATFPKSLRNALSRHAHLAACFGAS